MKTSAPIRLRPNRFLTAAQSIDSDAASYACNALGNDNNPEVNLFHRLYADNGDDQCGYSDTIANLHGATFSGAHDFCPQSAQRHRVIALCFAHWVARDIAAGKKPLG